MVCLRQGPGSDSGAPAIGHFRLGVMRQRPYLLKAPVSVGGGRETFLLLPENGIAGNSHMMMMDKNNL